MPVQQCLVSTSLLALCFAAPSVLGNSGDYDGDGRDDLAIGSPFEEVATLNDGAVNVLYGRGNGLRATRDQFWHADSPGIQGVAGPFAYLGVSVANGDFDGDGFDDLATGAMYETVDGFAYIGSVHVIYGSDDGLSPAGDQLWHRNAPGVQEQGIINRFGAALAAGDFDGDGFDDLAIGVPRDDIDGQVDAGSVHVLYGSNSGLTAIGDQIFSQNTSGIKEVASASDEFGVSLAAGDFDGDGHDDLAIGVPFKTVNAVANAGGVAVLYGSPSGLGPAGDQFWTQNSSGIKDVAESGDLFGLFMTSGDFDGDGRDDLAVGIPAEHVGAVADAGAVAVLYGSSSGLTNKGDQIWHENSSGIKGIAEAGNSFGWSPVAGDFDGDGFEDLAIGIPFQDVDSAFQAGAIAILYGSASGLSNRGDQALNQNTSGIKGIAATSDLWSMALYVGDFDGDGHDDLGVCASDENIDGVADGGSVTVLYGSPGGVSVFGDQVWTQDTAGVQDAAETSDQFGSLVGPFF